MIPEAGRDKLDEALARFDSELRNGSKWGGWEDRKSHKFAIRVNGKLYPVKEIISLATGASVHEFNGGSEANGYVEKRGLEVVLLREGELQVAEVPTSLDPLGVLADKLLLDRAYLAKVGELLKDKPQAIFYGPPGTGKTYVARKLAEHYVEETGGEVQLVQFHPSYAYEDFVQGYRPTDGGGFALVEGPLMKIAKKARENEDVQYVLIIDEINRGNVAKVFGELYFLLEYRDEEVMLQYSQEPFSLPKNLWIIGTMNTADRSIALIDAALRRRFYFVPFLPDEAPVEGLLRRWLKRNKPKLEWVADVVDRANDRLGERHAAIGPSYFMKGNLNAEWVERVWEHAVKPYLAEHFMGEEERLSEFTLDALRSESNGALTLSRSSDREGGI